VAQSRNLGVQLARGNYIGFLDGDDIWNPNKVAKQVELMDLYPDVDLCFSLSRRIDESGRDCGLPPPQMAEVISFRNLLRENLIRTPSSVMARKDALQSAGSFDPSLVPCEDYEMWIRISRLRHNNIRCLGEILAMYRRRYSQLTRNWRSVELSWNRMIQKINLREGQAVREMLPQARSRMYIYFASLAYENQEFPEALRLLWIGFQSDYRTSLLNARNWALVAATLSGSILPGSMHKKLENLCMRWITALFWRLNSV
jgi:glycosyltransferase involved in cell wall biosynthesis